MTPRNPADRPATEPKALADFLWEAQPGPWRPENRDTYEEDDRAIWLTNDDRDSLIIEADTAALLVNAALAGAEAAQGAAPDFLNELIEDSGPDFAALHDAAVQHRAAPRAEGLTGDWRVSTTHGRYVGATPRAEGHEGYIDEFGDERQALVAPRAEGLDVERLARALKAVRRQQDHEARRRKGYSDNYFDPEAEAIAAEYALSRPSDERVPESEEPR